MGKGLSIKYNGGSYTDNIEAYKKRQKQKQQQQAQQQQNAMNQIRTNAFPQPIINAPKVSQSQGITMKQQNNSIEKIKTNTFPQPVIGVQQKQGTTSPADAKGVGLKISPDLIDNKGLIDSKDLRDITGYTAEKIGAGLVDGLADGGNMTLGIGAKLAKLFTWGSWDKALEDYAETQLSAKTLGDKWSESAESRYHVPSWYRTYGGDTAMAFGSMLPSMLLELLTQGAAPTMLDAQIAQIATKIGKRATAKSVAKNLSTKIVKPKASDVVFGLSAAGSAAKEGYAISGDVGKSLNYGVLSGIGEVATEKIFGGYGGTDIGDSIVDFAKVKGLNKIAKNKYGKKVLDVITEPVEEMIMTASAPVFQRITAVDPNAEYASLKDYGESGLQGLLLSAFSNAATLPLRKYQKRKTVNILNKTSDGINAMLINEDDKLEPLKYNATEAEMKERQKQIEVFKNAYEAMLEDEIRLSNPELFKNDTVEISAGDKFRDTNTGNVYTVLKRDDTKTTVKIETSQGIITNQYDNNQFDNMIEKNNAESFKTTSFTQGASRGDSALVNNNISQNDNIVNNNSMYQQGNNMPSDSSVSREMVSNDLTGIKGNAGIVYNKVQAQLLAQLPIEALQNASDLASQRDIVFNDIGISDKGIIQQWIDAGLAHQATGKDGSTYYYIPAEFLLDERERRAGRLGNESVNKDISNADNEKNMYDIMDEMGLTYDEQRAILEYKSSGSYKINESLRKGKSLSKEQEKIKNDLNSAMDKFPVYKGTVYRNIGFETKEEFDKFIQRHNGKTSVIYSAFISASKTTDGYLVESPYRIQYEILSHNSKDMSNIGLVEENEVLFKTDTEFDIKSFIINGNEIKIICEERTNDGKELYSSIRETRNKEKSIRSIEQNDNFQRGNRDIEKMDSVREGSRNIHEISQGKFSSERGNAGRSNFPDSMELRNRDRDESQTQRVLQRDNVTNQILSAISRARGGAEISNEDIDLMIKNPEVFTALTGVQIKNNAETEIKQYVAEANKKNARTNSIISAISEKTGLVFDYDISLPANIQGYYDHSSGRIVLNPANEKSLDYAVAHELTHYAENKKGYKGYKKALLNSDFGKMDFYAKAGYSSAEEFDNYIEERWGKTYEHLKDGKDNEQYKVALEGEKIAAMNAFMIDHMNDIDLQNLARKDSGIKKVFRAIADFFREIFARLNGESEKAFALKMQRKFEKLLTADDDTNLKTSSSIQFSVINENGKNVIIIPNNIESVSFNDSKKYMLDLFRNLTGEKAIFTEYDKKYINVNRRAVNEFLSSEYVKKLTMDLKNVVYLSGKQLDELIKYSVPAYSFDNTSAKHQKDASKGWEYRNIIFEAPDFSEQGKERRRYEAKLIIRKNEMGEYSHGIIGLNKEGFAKYSMATNETAIIKKAKPSIDNIPQPYYIVNNNSMQNSENNSSKEILSAISRARGGAEISNEDIDLMIKNTEVFTALTGVQIKNNAEAEIKQYVAEANKKNARTNSIISAISEKTGLVFDYDISLPANIQGYYDHSSGRIVLNPANEKSLDYAVAHELTHYAENKKGYKNYANDLKNSRWYKDMLAEKYNGDEQQYYKAIYDKYYDEYKNHDNATLNSLIEREMIAAFNADVINMDDASFEKLANNDKGLKKIFRIISEFFKEIAATLKGDSERAFALKMQRRFSQLLTADDVKTSDDFKTDNKQYSINENYSREIEAWYKNGMSEEAFILGTTGDVLQGLGAIESDIYMLGNKIKEILNQHPEMTINEIKKIPQILENPILILKSQNKGRNKKQNTRLVIYGNVKTEDGKPVLSVLDLRPIENNLVIQDMQKVSSAYVKDTNPVNFIEESLVVYADKNRTTKLLRTIGFQMPIELQQSGYIGNISYIGQNVNINGEEFSKVFKKGNSQTRQYSVTETDVKKDTDREERYKQLIEEYRAIPQGENPYREVEVPARSSERKYVSRFARTIAEAEVMPEEMMSEFEELVMSEKMSHEVISDKKAEAKAIDKMKDEGYWNVYEEWKQNLGSRYDKKYVVQGQALFNQAATAKDVETAMELAADLAMLATETGQNLQALKMLKKMSPDGQLYALERTVSAINKKMEEQAEYKNAKPVKIKKELAKKLLEAKGEEIEQVVEEIQQDIAEQVPATVWDKINAWRYLSMLGNIRTHIRNILGNAMFKPMVGTKDMVATVLEKVLIKNTEERTKAMPFMLNKEDKAYAKEDFKKIIDIIKGDKYDLNKGIMRKMTIFKTKLLEWLRITNSNLLEAEDNHFFESAYVNAFA